MHEETKYCEKWFVDGGRMKRMNYKDEINDNDRMKNKRENDLVILSKGVYGWTIHPCTSSWTGAIIVNSYWSHKAASTPTVNPHLPPLFILPDPHLLPIGWSVLSASSFHSKSFDLPTGSDPRTLALRDNSNRLIGAGLRPSGGAGPWPDPTRSSRWSLSNSPLFVVNKL